MQRAFASRCENHWILELLERHLQKNSLFVLIHSFAEAGLKRI
jgi:hypothetical protein